MQGLDQVTREEFNSTYRGLLDQLNEKKKAGLKFDFANELKVYERDNELDTNGYFKVCCHVSLAKVIVCLFTNTGMTSMYFLSTDLSQNILFLCSCAKKVVNFVVLGAAHLHAQAPRFLPQHHSEECEIPFFRGMWRM